MAPRQNSFWHHRKSYFKFIVILVLIGYILFYMPTPYVVYQPGSAIAIRPMVETKQNAGEEEGAVFLTTVSMSYPYANVYKTALSLLHPHMNLAKRADVFGDESTKEYSQRQSYVMKTSQSNAIQAVYHALHIPYKLKTQSITVLSTMPGTPAEKVLEPGDRIVALDGKPIEESDDLIQSISEKKVGDTVQVTFIRKDKEQTESVNLADISAEDHEQPRPGLGIYLAAVQTVQAEDDDWQVELIVEDIGGPSAGLMFALQIYNLLTPEDITKGYRIAGTGTISVDGQVGIIGGIEYKVVGAERQHADIFFTPHDWIPENEDQAPILNYSLAKQKAEQIGTDMKIVPVSTFEEVLRYLEQLPPKKSN